jgi:hypothetical protein
MFFAKTSILFLTGQKIIIIKQKWFWQKEIQKLIFLTLISKYQKIQKKFK